VRRPFVPRPSSRTAGLTRNWPVARSPPRPFRPERLQHTRTPEGAERPGVPRPPPTSPTVPASRLAFAGRTAGFHAPSNRDVPARSLDRRAAGATLPPHVRIRAPTATLGARDRRVIARTYLHVAHSTSRTTRTRHTNPPHEPATRTRHTAPTARRRTTSTRAERRRSRRTALEATSDRRPPRDGRPLENARSSAVPTHVHARPPDNNAPPAPTLP
jgi:hypothetical protein